MAKQTGLGDRLFVDGVNVSGDIGSLGRIGGGPSPLTVTGIDKSAVERLGGIRTGSLEFTSYFNPAVDQEHATLSTLPRTDRIVTYSRGLAQGVPAACCVAKQLNYDATRGEDGALTFDTEVQSNGFGVEWGVLVTAGVESVTGTGPTEGHDFGSGPTAFGFQAYLQVLAFTGTSATLTFQGSSDDGATDPYSGVTAFTAVTAVGAQRFESARDAAVEQWIRLNVTGTFSVLDFVVTVVRNDTEVVF